MVNRKYFGEKDGHGPLGVTGRRKATKTPNLFPTDILTGYRHASLNMAGIIKASKCQEQFKVCRSQVGLAKCFTAGDIL
jgi:hypothetical protein